MAQRLAGDTEGTEGRWHGGPSEASREACPFSHLTPHPSQPTSPYGILRPAGHTLGREDEEISVLKPVGAHVRGQGSVLLGVGQGPQASPPAGVTGSRQEGRAQIQGQGPRAVGMAYKSLGLSKRQSWLHPKSAASCTPWLDELTSLGLSFLICKSKTVTGPTLQGHGRDSVRSSVFSSAQGQHRANTWQHYHHSHRFAIGDLKDLLSSGYVETMRLPHLEVINSLVNKVSYFFILRELRKGRGAGPSAIFPPSGPTHGTLPPMSPNAVVLMCSHCPCSPLDLLH